jgi:hypothetical protein
MSVAGPDSPIVPVFGEIYGHCPKCVTDRITFHEILEVMIGGTGVALRVRIQNAVADGRRRGDQATHREMMALGKVLDLIDSFQSR